MGIGGKIKLEEGTAGGTYVGFKAPDTEVVSDLIWTLPSADGTNGQFLATNGSGTLSWGDIGAEITARTNADSTLQGNINSEITARSNADSTLTSNLNSEITARINADSTLTSNLSNLSGRNRIVNGNFDFWQRGTSFTPASNTYTADRWVTAFNGTGATRTVSRQDFALGQTDVSNNPKYFLRFNQSVAGSAGTYNAVQQRLEGVQTFSGQVVTLSFWAKAASSLSLDIKGTQYFGAGGSPSALVSIDISLAQTITTSWTKYTKTVTIPSVSGKTLGTDGNDYLSLDFVLPNNTTFTFDIAQVQIEPGSMATPFEYISYTNELALCQRYYEKGVDNNTYTAGTSGQSVAYGGSTYSNAYFGCAVQFKVTKRISGATTYCYDSLGAGGTGAAARCSDDHWGASSQNGLTMLSVGANNDRALFIANSGQNIGNIRCSWAVDAELY